LHLATDAHWTRAVPSRAFGPLLLSSHGEEFDETYPGLHLATDGHYNKAVPSRAFGPLLLSSQGDELDETYPGLHLATDGQSALREIALTLAINKMAAFIYI
jgi:hypothetical protein